MNLSVGLEVAAVAAGVRPRFFVDQREPLLAVASTAEVGGVDTTRRDC
jgi:hypothetical protein